MHAGLPPARPGVVVHAGAGCTRPQERYNYLVRRGAMAHVSV